MSFEIAGAQGKLITVKVSGLLKFGELRNGQKTMGELIDTLGKVRMLVLVSDFKGFEKAGNWEENSFQEKYDSFIEKIGIVGDKSLEGVALMFTCKGLRPVAIEFFKTIDLPKARIWLAH